MVPIIRLQRVSKAFRQQQVLRDLSFEIPRGQCVAVIGESGCGKTVLLKLLIALLQPSRGTVEFDGMNLANYNELELAEIRKRYGFVFQMAALFDSMTIEENIAFPLIQNTNRSRYDIREQTIRELANVGLKNTVLKKRPAELSGGMRKRVGLARALTLDPELILYDEPTTGLDPIMTAVINELILKTQQSRNVTSVVVTHDMTTVRRCADRVIMLFPLIHLEPDEPQIIFDGTPQEMENFPDPRVIQFIHGEAGERIIE